MLLWPNWFYGNGSNASVKHQFRFSNNNYQLKMSLVLVKMTTTSAKRKASEKNSVRFMLRYSFKYSLQRIIILLTVFYITHTLFSRTLLKKNSCILQALRKNEKYISFLRSHRKHISRLYCWDNRNKEDNCYPHTKYPYLQIYIYLFSLVCLGSLLPGLAGMLNIVQYFSSGNKLLCFSAGSIWVLKEM